MDISFFHSVRVVGAIFSILLLLTVIYIVKERRMQEKYSLIWIFIAVFVLIISLFRGFIEWFSSFIGIYYAPSAFFSILIVCSYLLLLNMSVITSTLKKQNKNMIQEIGLLRLQIEEMEQKLRESDEKSSS